MDGVTQPPVQVVPLPVQPQYQTVKQDPLAEGIRTSEHDKVSKASDTANFAMLSTTVPAMLAILKGADLAPAVQIAILVSCAALFAIAFLSKIWLARQYSFDRTKLKMASIPPGAQLVRNGGIVALLLILALPFLSGCQTSVAVTQSNKDAQAAVAGTGQDVEFIANLIASNWASHEAEKANRLFQDALKADAVSATVAPPANAVPNPAPPASTVLVVPEPTRTILQDKLSAELAAIAVGKQQIYQSVINRFAGNLTAAQTLMQGQQQYYATAGAQATTLQQGTQTILDLFQQFAPVVATAIAPAKKS